MAYMRRLASRLAANGFVLRSGGADGADKAFQAGCEDAGGRSEIWLPWQGFNGAGHTGLYPGKAHFDLASQLHPAWASLPRSVRSLHARNVGQVLGANLDVEASFVICWTPDGCESHASRTKGTGGTGMAISVATALGRSIPVFNLANEGASERLNETVLALIERARQALQDDFFRS